MKEVRLLLLVQTQAVTIMDAPVRCCRIALAFVCALSAWMAIVRMSYMNACINLVDRHYTLSVVDFGRHRGLAPPTYINTRAFDHKSTNQNRGRRTASEGKNSFDDGFRAIP